MKNWIITTMMLCLFLSFELPGVANEKTKTAAGNGTTNSVAGRCYTINVAIDVDYSFFSSHDGDRTAIVQNAMDAVKMASAIYESAFGLKFNVSVVTTYNAPTSDPYFGIDDPTGLFNKAKTLHETHATPTVFDFVIVLTAKDLGDVVGLPVAGKAFSLGGMYVRDNAYILCNYLTDQVIAHEIGHLLGAAHCDADCDSLDAYHDCDPKPPLIPFGSSLMCGVGGSLRMSFKEMMVMGNGIFTNMMPGFVGIRKITGSQSLGNVVGGGTLLEIENSTTRVATTDLTITSGNAIQILPGTKFIAANSVHKSQLLIDPSVYNCASMARVAQADIIQPVPEIESETHVTSLAPNPSTGNVVLSYWLERDMRVSITIIDLMGRSVKDVLHLENLSEGAHTATINMNDYARGVYTVRIEREENVEAVRMMIE